MKKLLAILLMLCWTLLVADLNLCMANPYGPPQAIVITIKKDGGVDPTDSPLKPVGDNQYVLTENLNATIVSLFERYIYRINIEKDDVVIDGATHVIDGPGRLAIGVAYRDNVTIQNIVLSGYEIGIEIWCSSNINVTGSSILSGKRGIIISNSSNIVIAENIFADNYEQATIDMKNSNSSIIYGNKFSCIPIEGWLISGLRMEFCKDNHIIANTITKFYSGITLLNSSVNYFYQNNLIDNYKQAQDLFCNETFQRINEDTKRMIARNFTHLLYPILDYSVNVWKNNFWSDYNDNIGNNNLGASSYVIDERNADNSPSTSKMTLEQTISLGAIKSTNYISSNEEETDGHANYLPELLPSIVIIGIIIASIISYYKNYQKRLQENSKNNGNIKQ